MAPVRTAPRSLYGRRRRHPTPDRLYGNDLDDGGKYRVSAPTKSHKRGGPFPFHRSEPGTARLDLFDVRGNTVYQTEQTGAAGNDALELPAETGIPAGVYAWRVQVGQTTKTGRLVRL